MNGHPELNGSKGSTFNFSTGTEAVNIPLYYLIHFYFCNISINIFNTCSGFYIPLLSIILISISLVGRLNPVTSEPNKEIVN